MSDGKGCLPHTVQSPEPAFPALCRVHVGLNDVLLSLCSSLPGLRGKLSFLVRLVHGYYGTVRLLLYVHVRRSVYGLRGPVLVFAQDVQEISRFSCMLFLSVRGFSDYAGPSNPLAIIVVARVAFLPSERSRRAVQSAFRSSIARPTDTSVYASSGISRRRMQDSRPGWIRCSFPVGLFHPLQHAGLSRRSPGCRLTGS